MLMTVRCPFFINRLNEPVCTTLMRICPRVFPQDWSKRAVEEILSQLAPPEGEGLEGQVSTADEGEDGRAEMLRSVDQVPSRERKVGCKNFYWKGPTSC